MKNFTKPIIVLTVICFVIVGLLAFTYQFTKPYIDAAKEAATQEALTEVFPGDVVFERQEDSKLLSDSITAVYAAKQDGNDAGFVFTVVVKGYGGKVETMIGVDGSGAVTGVKVTEHGETPGLGAKATVAGYLEQYKGMTVSEPDLISGATITSTAIKNAVQTALDAYGASTEGGEG